MTGGTREGEGNVFAYNSQTREYGPVCDRYWDIIDVSSNGYRVLVCFLNCILRVVNVNLCFLNIVDIWQIREENKLSGRGKGELLKNIKSFNNIYRSIKVQKLSI